MQMADYDHFKLHACLFNTLNDQKKMIKHDFNGIYGHCDAPCEGSFCCHYYLYGSYKHLLKILIPKTAVHLLPMMTA